MFEAENIEVRIRVIAWVNLKLNRSCFPHNRECLKFWARSWATATVAPYRSLIVVNLEQISLFRDSRMPHFYSAMTLISWKCWQASKGYLGMFRIIRYKGVEAIIYTTEVGTLIINDMDESLGWERVCQWVVLRLQFWAVPGILQRSGLVLVWKLVQADIDLLSWPRSWMIIALIPENSAYFFSSGLENLLRFWKKAEYLIFILKTTNSFAF